MSKGEEHERDDVPEDFATEREESIELWKDSKRWMTVDKITMYDRCVIPGKKRSKRKRRKQPTRKTARKSRNK